MAGGGGGGGGGGDGEIWREGLVDEERRDKARWV